MLKWWRCCKGGLCCTPLPAPPQEKRSLLHSCAQPNAGLCIPGSAAGREGRECNKGVQMDQGGTPPPPSGIFGSTEHSGFGVTLQHRAWRGFTCTKNRLGATGCVLMKEESIRLRAAQPPGAADYFPPSFSLSLTLCCCLRGSHERSEARSSFSLAFRLKKKTPFVGKSVQSIQLKSRARP